MRREHILYVLVAVATPLAIAGVVLAWIGGYLKGAILFGINLFGINAVAWSCVVLYTAQKIAKRRKAGKRRRATKRNPFYRYLYIFIKVSAMIWLLFGIAGEVIVLVIDNNPLYVTFVFIWFIIAGLCGLIIPRFIIEE